MPKRIDMAGERFGRLVVLKFDKKVRSRNSAWICECDCGAVVSVARQELVEGKTRSCGCLRRERTAEVHTTHGKTNTDVYGIWGAMIQRCSNPKRDAFPYYGGRGINVCERWRNSFEAFCEDMGNRPESYTLDRIDPDGNYEPDNCRWVTWSVQVKNRRKVA